MASNWESEKEAMEWIRDCVTKQRKLQAEINELKDKLDKAVAEENRCKVLVIRAAEWERDSAQTYFAIASVEARKAQKKYEEMLQVATKLADEIYANKWHAEYKLEEVNEAYKVAQDDLAIAQFSL
jgi:cell division septum initiation protein DivIVA